MEVGLSMLHCLGEPFPNLCRRLEEAEVKFVELVDDGWHRLDQERVEQLDEISSSKGLTYTVHAPFANINIAAPAEDLRAFMLQRLEKTLAFAAALDCQLVVFHPGWRTGISDFYPNLDWKININSVHKLLEKSRDYGVKIAIENCPEPYGFVVKNVAQFSRFFKELGEDIGLVLDVGHSNIGRETDTFIKTFGKRIAHIHAHDNDGKHDLHWGVGDGTIDWQQFVTNIKTMGFNEIIMIESYSNIKKSIETLRDAIT